MTEKIGPTGRNPVLIVHTQDLLIIQSIRPYQRETSGYPVFHYSNIPLFIPDARQKPRPQKASINSPSCRISETLASRHCSCKPVSSFIISYSLFGHMIKFNHMLTSCRLSRFFLKFYTICCVLASHYIYMLIIVSSFPACCGPWHESLRYVYVTTILP